MSVSVAWFIGLMVLALGMFLLGRRLGACHRAVGTSAVLIAVAAVGASTIFRFRPVLLHMHLPLDITVWFEGLVALFPWMVLVGVLSTSEVSPQLRRATPLLVALGGAYFLFGGIWMVLPTIRVGEPEKMSPAGISIQNRHDTCVPTSCANALRMMGIAATEERMCEVVMAKPGRGSSLARAAYGLRDVLARHDMTLSLQDLSAEQAVAAASPQRPVLAVIRSGIAADHMIVLLGATEDGNVLIANPSPGGHGGVAALPLELGYGLEVFTPEDFARLYRRGAILFHDLVEPLSLKDSPTIGSDGTPS